jgi:transposase InsO family protein
VVRAAVRRLRKPAVLVAACVLVVGAGGVETAARVRLPHDHFGHAAGIEWWYVTGLVRGADGRRYTVFFTLFKRGGFVLPVSQVVDLDSGTIVGHSESVAPRKVGASSLDVRTPTAALRFVPSSNRWHFAARRGRSSASRWQGRAPTTRRRE